MSLSKKAFLFYISFLGVLPFSVNAQTPVTQSSSEIFLQLKKLNVLGSVLYIAAHPDDENNGLLPFLAKEKLYRTGYLSLTRGDGGQNLIGSEQGIELGLIRTQELLAARKIDGSEQYFTRAYEFGFSKSAEEALRIWDREKILSDVVWNIRKFQPDVIITRFPGDARAGHGHHAASSLLAQEAYKAAADPAKFPEQFRFGVKPWQAKRILWNTYNFGGNNTTSNDQFSMQVGDYNPLLGKSYGELGGEARSMHKSQGEGRPRRKGPVYEFFKAWEGETPKNDLMEGVVIDWSRISGGHPIQSEIEAILRAYQFDHPENSVPALVSLYKKIKALPQSNWRDKKLAETQDLVEACSAIFSEATTSQDIVIQGGSLNVNFFFNNRSGTQAVLKKIGVEQFDSTLNTPLGANVNLSIAKTLPVAPDKQLSQPYWLQYPTQEATFDVRDQQLIGKAENDPAFTADFTINIAGEDFVFTKPVWYKLVDPTRGELYQPLAVYPKAEINFTSDNFVSLNGAGMKLPVHLKINSPDITGYPPKESVTLNFVREKTAIPVMADKNKDAVLMYKPVAKLDNYREELDLLPTDKEVYAGSARQINYDHIPTITYFSPAKTNLVKLDVKTLGKKIGYIVGAGDKVPQALEQLGYEVTLLSEADITAENLPKFDAIITGIRAYNIYEYLTNKNDLLNQYVENGGNLIVQYLKSNQVGNKRVKVGPYPFVVNSGSRVTQENAKVTFLLPEHRLLNYPNKITEKDFEGWIQERSTYQAEQTDSHFEAPLGMNDAGEKQADGSLITAKYGKGNITYVSLVLFRQLPAGVPGGFRLLANIVSQPKNN